MSEQPILLVAASGIEDARYAWVCYTGARPMFVHTDPKSFTIDINQLKAAVTPRTKVILHNVHAL